MSDVKKFLYGMLILLGMTLLVVWIAFIMPWWLGLGD